MPIIAKKKQKQQFPQATNGLHPALVLDVQDLGLRNGPWGEKHKIRLLYLTDELDKEGQPILVSEFYALSLHEQSKLFGTITTITGEEPDDEFDCESLIGMPCRILTKQSDPDADGIVYANIANVLPAEPADPKLTVPIDYVRLQDRVKTPRATNGSAKPLTARKPQAKNLHGLQITNEDVPF